MTLFLLFVLLGVALNFYLLVKYYNAVMVTENAIYYPDSKKFKYEIIYRTKHQKQIDFLKGLPWIFWLLCMTTLFFTGLTYLMIGNLYRIDRVCVLIFLYLPTVCDWVLIFRD